MTEHARNENDSLASDIPIDGWVDRFIPQTCRPYIRLARFDRPIGTWLLLFPCWWSISMAWPEGKNATEALYFFCIFGIGALTMRGAGCTFNDIVDRNFDAQVSRTRNRPLPSGQVTVRQALAFLIVLLAIGFYILISLKPYAIKPCAIRPYAIKPYALKPYVIKPYAIKPNAMKPYGLKPNEVKEMLIKKNIRVLETGISHGTLTIILNNKKFEITTLRKDIATDGRHANVEYTLNWEEDALRRDFTINAIYADIEGRIFDPLKGISDLKDGKIKFEKHRFCVFYKYKKEPWRNSEPDAPNISPRSLF